MADYRDELSGIIIRDRYGLRYATYGELEDRYRDRLNSFDKLPDEQKKWQWAGNEKNWRPLQPGEGLTRRRRRGPL